MTDGNVLGGEAAPGRTLPDGPPPVRPGLPAGLHRAVRDRLWMWWAGLPPWGQALAVYLGTRVVDFAIIDRVARFQPASVWNGPDPGYLGMVSLWDGDWYRRIAENGYPTTVPHDAAGAVEQNAWAFYPLYPAVVRAVMMLTGAGWQLAASTTSLACGAAAVVVMRSLVERVAGRRLALWTVALFAAFPAAPILQVAYTESLSMLLIVSVLWCLQRRCYLLGALPMLLIGISRPVAVPMAGVIGLHLIMRLWRRRTEPLGAGALSALLTLVIAAGVAAITWPATAALVTGDPTAYTDTEAAWRVSRQIVPLRPWWDNSQFVLGAWAGPITVLVGIVASVIWLTRRSAAVIAGDLRAWAFCYGGYLLLALDPFTGLARMVLPLFPLGTLLAAASRSRAYRWALVAAFIAGQVVWVAWLWRFSPPADWPP